MNRYEKLFTEDRRLVILRALEAAPGYGANEYVLQTQAAHYGHSVSRDLIRTDIAWLAEQGLASVTEAGGTRVATLTDRGLDVAAGRATVPGVKRPTPGDV